MIVNLPKKLNEAGKIKIGKKGAEVESKEGRKFRQPMRLDHFIITTTEKDENGDFIEDVELMDKIKESGRSMVNKDGNIIGIPIRLLYDDNELNFPNRYASYVSGQLSCHGNGQVAFSRLDEFQKEKKCPCQRLDFGYSGKDKCKPNGALKCVIDEAQLFGQAHTFRTTSINSVAGILGGLHLIKAATHGRISGLPLILTVNNKSTTTGSGHSTTIQVVSVCYQGDMASLRQSSLEFSKENQLYLSDIDRIEKEAFKNGGACAVPEEEDKDFVEEFYPDARSTTEAEVIGVDMAAGKDTIEIIEVKGGEVVEQLEKDPPVLVEPIEIKDQDMYDRFLAEDDYDKKTALAKRLRKETLIYHLQVMKYGPIPESGNKPVYLNLVVETITSKLFPNGVVGDSAPPAPQNDIEVTEEKNPEVLDQFIIELIQMKKQQDVLVAMRERFEGAPINGTLPIPDLIEKAKRLLDLELHSPAAKEPAPEKKKITDEERAWDDGGLVEVEQLREMAKLKEFLKVENDAWFKMVGVFKGMDGSPVEKATLLTQKQARVFILILQEEAGDIPF